MERGFFLATDAPFHPLAEIGVGDCRCRVPQQKGATEARESSEKRARAPRKEDTRGGTRREREGGADHGDASGRNGAVFETCS